MKKDIKTFLKKKILILDGAMATQIQKYNPIEPEYRKDKRFNNSSKELSGFYELLNITRPDIISEIHEKYLKYGADIIETNTFRANNYFLEQYQIENITYELNLKSAKLAREKAIKYTNLTFKKPRFVAGAIGPLPENLPLSQMQQIYTEQIKGLLAGKVDFILLETMTNYQSIEAAISSLNQIMQKRNKTFYVAISISETTEKYTPLTLELLQQIEEKYNNIEILAVGENCGLGFAKIYQNIKKYKNFPYPIIAYPNSFDENQNIIDQGTQLEYAKKMIEENLVNIIGGCCGTNYNLIRNLEKITRNKPPRPLKIKS